MSTVAINGARQLLRPPEDGLPYLRHDRAGELRVEPGSLLIEDEAIAGWQARTRPMSGSTPAAAR